MSAVRRFGGQSSELVIGQRAICARGAGLNLSASASTLAPASLEHLKDYTPTITKVEPSGRD